MSGTPWSSDFHFQGGRVKVRATGADLALDRALFTDIRLWLGYYVPVRLKGLWTRLARPGPAVWFTPAPPRPWYLVGLAVFWGGIRLARTPAEAQAAFYFEDSTVGRPPACDLARRFNFDCPDVSKSHVAGVFEAVFGYPLTVDPTTWEGPAVEKGEDNGAHDGRLVTCPCPPCAPSPPSTARSASSTSTRTSTRGTPTSAPTTRTARRSVAPRRRGCCSRIARRTSESAARCTARKT